MADNELPLTQENLGGELARQGFFTANEEVNKALAEQFGLPICEEIVFSALPVERLQQVPYSFAKRYCLLPISDDGYVVKVAIADPLHLEPIEELRLIFSCPIEVVYGSKTLIQDAINHCYNQESGAASQLIATMGEVEEGRGDTDLEVYDLLDSGLKQAPIIRLLNLILIEAIQQGASDIHFEPYEDRLRVRYRIDGVLQNRHAPSQEYQQQLITRIKVMAKLDIAEHRLPQDGRIKLRMGGREIDFRVSTVPVAGGERIVLRILDKGNVILGLDKLNMPPDLFEQFCRLIAMPEGILLVTGPTGSGKTTTLYSAISGLNSDETNIMTIEDPVEYNLRGIAQIGVRPKINLTFAAGLRHILRQDPDIIMIGEIRDVETAEIAIQASLTGHLVLSTLHTNDAPSAITRLVDMGIVPYLLSSSVIGILAQRLVRKICSECREGYTPDEKELRNIGLTEGQLTRGQLFRGKGCSQCYGLGFRGRHAIYELLMVNNAIKKQIVSSPDAVELRSLALDNGMKSMLSHGSLLAVEGITTVAEVLRVTRGMDEG